MWDAGGVHSIVQGEIEFIIAEQSEERVVSHMPVKVSGRALGKLYQAVRRLLTILAVLVVVALAVDRFMPLSALWHAPTGKWSQACRIKGNISQNGERIYHVPGGRWYARTRIDRFKGERWFCSEEEARAAGWRKSYR